MYFTTQTQLLISNYLSYLISISAHYIPGIQWTFVLQMFRNVRTRRLEEYNIWALWLHLAYNKIIIKNIVFLIRKTWIRKLLQWRWWKECRFLLGIKIYILGPLMYQISRLCIDEISKQMSPQIICVSDGVQAFENLQTFSCLVTLLYWIGDKVQEECLQERNCKGSGCMTRL